MKIKTASLKYDLPANTLRYWERVGAIPPVHRDQAGYRDYDQNDLDWICFAKYMRHAGLSVDYLIEFVKLYQQSDRTIADRKQLLAEQLTIIQQKLADLQTTYNVIKERYDNYDDAVEVCAPVTTSKV
ncbi:MerR family transcriptional regulator [Lapidilactobacillus wuchangensis]|uniref:MerR family transcriptional regulator n=1 Tax=Lapidilactobacillus wuchangensis TaxID=2486001 RepID=UPI000F774D5F|nr:MerR family transcriptional regulator [Lapidilactobacillus wuchangensis]